ncbi:MAG: ribulose-bisphosphate carboxylase large subunit family protein [Halobacteriaceae archaeon]
MRERIRATYLVETAEPLHDAARALAGEQSSGTFVAVPGESDELRERHGATVEEVVEIDTAADPSLPGAAAPDPGERYTLGEVVVSFPVENVGTSLPNLRATVAGNCFELHQFSGLRLKALDLPGAFARENPGPQFGIEGTRELVGVEDRPLVGTIVKPNVGLSPAEAAETVREVLEAGLDFVKDDELVASPPYSPVAERVEAVMEVIREHERETGETVMYACNVTGSVDEMLERHDQVVDAGGNCVMVSLNSVGISGLLALRDHAEVPIHAHRNGWGALSRHPLLGFDYAPFHKFFRLAGADHVHVNGLRNKFCESDASVIRSARACQTPIADADDVVLPVFSSGQWAGQAPDTYEALGNADLLYLAGGGILGHPDGPAAGVAHLKQGWEAAMAGVPLDEYAEDHPELRAALEYYGPVGNGR